MARRISLAIMGIVLLLLAACGGGGGGGAPQNPCPGTANLQWIWVEPSSGADIGVGATAAFTVTGYYTDYATYATDKDLTRCATWTSSNESVATVSRGVVTGVAAGSSVKITASYGTESDYVWVDVVIPLVSIEVTPASASLMVGQTQPFTAIGTYADSSTQPITSSVTWTSSNMSAATINSSGLATGAAAGNTTITASLNGISDTASLSVSPQRPDLTITVSEVESDGADVTISYIVTNTGVVNAGAFDVDVWADLASAPSMGTTGTAKSYTGLVAGTNISDSIVVPSSLFSGTAYAIVDTMNNVIENDEADNISAAFAWPQPAKIALFVDTVYVDFLPGTVTAEASNLRETVLDLGHSFSGFTGVTDAAINTAVSGKTVLAFPELEKADLSAALSTYAPDAIRNFVSGGGTLLLFGDSSGNFARIVNTTFGFSVSSTPASGTFSLNAAEATGTPLASGPATLPLNPDTTALTAASLPAGASAIYNSASGDSILTVIPHGGGNIVIFGWDWNNAAPTGTMDGGWNSALNLLLYGYGGSTVGFGCSKVVDTLGGTCEDITNGFKLTAPAGGYLSYGGYTFDDSSTSGVGPKNICSLALFGNGGTVLYQPISASTTYDYGLAYQQHWNGYGYTCSYDYSLLGIGSTIDWTSYPLGNSCSGDTDTDSPTVTLTCTYSVSTGALVASPATYNFDDGLVPEEFAMSGEIPWAPDVATGALRSGVISSNYGTSCFAVTASGTSGVVFDLSMSADSWVDLVFYVDGAQVSYWSGTVAWTNYNYPAAVTGTHTYKWCYQADYYRNGADAAWVDNITIY